MTSPCYHFDEFELDRDRFELRRNGHTLKLERIPMELLMLLLERQGSVVTRQEIVDRLWGKDVFVDTEHGVNTTIRKVRQALKDDPEQPRFILTVSGKGYRFVAGENGNQRSAAPSETPTAIPEREPRPSGSDVSDRGPDAAVMPAVQNNRAKLAIVIAICVVVAAILISFLRRRIRVAAQPADPTCHQILSDSYHFLGRDQEAITEFEQTLLLFGQEDAVPIVQQAFERGGFAAVAAWQADNHRSPGKVSTIDPGHAGM
jgi:DNA-binding winged helix-turn-helix (wHTH) protein